MKYSPHFLTVLSFFVILNEIATCPQEIARNSACVTPPDTCFRFLFFQSLLFLLSLDEQTLSNLCVTCSISCLFPPWQLSFLLTLCMKILLVLLLFLSKNNSYTSSQYLLPILYILILTLIFTFPPFYHPLFFTKMFVLYHAL